MLLVLTLDGPHLGIAEAPEIAPHVPAAVGGHSAGALHLTPLGGQNGEVEDVEGIPEATGARQVEAQLGVTIPMQTQIDHIVLIRSGT